MPRRFSLRLLLLFTTVTCATLAYRLWPLQPAREFARIAEQQGLRAALHKVNQETGEQLNTYAAKSNYPDVELVSMDDAWQVLRSGKCRVTLRVRWTSFTSGGKDSLIVEFLPHGCTKHTVSRVGGTSGFFFS